jgi:hypothetical protein
MLVTNARLRPGEEVLVWGAGSGVGSAAIQIAKAHHARVIAVAGDDWKLERAKQLGADETVNHRTQNVLEEVRRLTGRRGVDVVFEHVGRATWEVSVKALARGGRLVTCGATSGAVVETDVRYVFGKAISVHGTWVGSKGELWDLLPLVEAGVLKPVVDRTFPLSQAQEAHAYLEAGQHFGRSSWCRERPWDRRKAPSLGRIEVGGQDRERGVDHARAVARSRAGTRGTGSGFSHRCPGALARQHQGGGRCLTSRARPRTWGWTTPRGSWTTSGTSTRSWAASGVR